MIDLTTYNYPFKYIYVSSNGWIQLSSSNVLPSESISGINNNLPTDVIRIFSTDLDTTVKYTITSNYIYLNYTGFQYGIPFLMLNIDIAIDTNGIIVAKYILSSYYTNGYALVGFTGSDSTSSSDDLYLINNTSAQNLYDLLNNKCVQFYSKITAIELINLFSVPTLQQLNLFNTPPASANDFNTVINSALETVVNLPSTLTPAEIQTAVNNSSTVNTALNSSDKLDLVTYLLSIGFFKESPDATVIQAAINSAKEFIISLSDSLTLSLDK
jgi:hypothetical protein